MKTKMGRVKPLLFVGLCAAQVSCGVSSPDAPQVASQRELLTTVAASSTLAPYSANYTQDGWRGAQSDGLYWNDGTRLQANDSVTVSFSPAKSVSKITLQGPVMDVSGPYTLSGITVEVRDANGWHVAGSNLSITSGTSAQTCVDAAVAVTSTLPITDIQVTFGGTGNTDGWNFLGEIAIAQTPSLQAAIDWLEDKSKVMVPAARRTMTGGPFVNTAAYPPQAGAGYDGFWLRDYAYMLEGRANTFPSADLRSAANVFLNAQRADGAQVDTVKLDGTPYYEPGYGTIGTNPVADGSQFAVNVMWLSYLALQDRSFVSATMRPKLAAALNATPRDPATGLVWIDPSLPYDRAPYGFTDSVHKTGYELFSSLLFVQAAHRFADLLRVGDSDSTAVLWDAEANRVAQSIRTNLWDTPSGLFKAASVLCAQPDIWGSIFAVRIGVASTQQRQSVASYMASNYDALVKRGQLRHLPAGMSWEATYWNYQLGTYQNGAYWATPVGWMSYALDKVDHTKADAIARALVDDFIATNDTNEVINDNYRNATNYMASVTVPLENLKVTQALRTQPTSIAGLSAWLRADTGTSSGPTQFQWADQSSSGHNASQGVGAAYPSVVSNSILGLPVVRFSKAGEFRHLNLPSTATLGMQSHDYEILVVARTSGDNVQFLTSGGYADGYEYFELHLNGASGARFIPNHLASGNKFADIGTPGSYSDGLFHVFDVRVENDTGKIRVDGKDGATTVSGARANQARPLTLGIRGDGSYPLASDTTDGVADVFEVLLFNRALSSTERAQVEKYLRARVDLPQW